MKVFEIVTVTASYGGDTVSSYHVERHTLGQAVAEVEKHIDQHTEIVSAKIVKTTLVPFRKEVPNEPVPGA